MSCVVCRVVGTGCFASPPCSVLSRRSTCGVRRGWQGAFVRPSGGAGCLLHAEGVARRHQLGMESLADRMAVDAPASSPIPSRDEMAWQPTRPHRKPARAGRERPGCTELRGLMGDGREPFPHQYRTAPRAARSWPTGRRWVGPARAELHRCPMHSLNSASHWSGGPQSAQSHCRPDRES